MTTWTPEAYVDLSDVKDALGLDGDDARRDADLTGKILSASRMIDDFCGRYFGKAGADKDFVVRVYDTTGPTLVIDDLVTLDSIEYASGTSWVAYDDSLVTLLPRNAAVEVPPRPYTMLSRADGVSLPEVIRVTGEWGWPTVPQPIRDATIIQTVRLAKSKDVSLGVVGGDSMMGVLRLSSSMHPDAALLCAPFQRVSLG
jgi:hypothetical protein